MNKICEECGKRFAKKWNYSKRYFATQKYCSRVCMSNAYKRLGIGNYLLGKWSSEHRGDKHPSWNGGFNKNEWRKSHPGQEKLYRQHRSEASRKKRNEYSRKYKLEHRVRYTYLQNQRKMKIRNIGGAFSFNEWENLCLDAGGKCKICGKLDKLTIDHIIPISKGGDNSLKNIQPLCLKCNMNKSNNLTAGRCLGI